MAREEDETIRLYALRNNTVYELSTSAGLIKEVDGKISYS
jgi:hypothetical protein